MAFKRIAERNHRNQGLADSNRSFNYQQAGPKKNAIKFTRHSR